MPVNHSIRVANLSYNLATLLNLSKKQLNSIFKSALYHDIGKNYLNYNILNKKDKLTEEEFNHIKKHSIYGYKNAKYYGLNKMESLNILHHHENYDGSGYPSNLKGEDIPLGSRIIRICDVYDALTSKRPYRKEVFTKEKALKVLELEKDKYDPGLYNFFFQMQKEVDSI